MHDEIEDEVQPSAYELRKLLESVRLQYVINYNFGFPSALDNLIEMRAKKTHWYGMCEESVRTSIDEYIKSMLYLQQNKG